MLTNAVYATLELELTQGVDSALPIAIVPFANQDSIASDDNKISNVVSNDLKNSGRFRLTDLTTVPPQALTAVQDGQALDYNSWQQLKTDDVVTGQIKKVSGGEYQVSFQLFDIYNKNKILEQQYTVTTEKLRPLAHHISDLIYQKLTGDRGVFSTKIAYIVVNRQGRQAQYRFEVADVDGYNPRTLLSSSAPLMSPAWSPDGQRIAYVSFEGNRASIYIQDVTTGQRNVVAKYPGINGAPAWSPDSKKLALVLTQTGYPKIYVLDLTTNDLQRITDDWYIDTEPAWAPDGKSIIFTSNRGGNPQIYRVALDNKKVQRISFNGPYNARASFTPDGKNIVMLHQNGEMFSIAQQELSSGRVTVLTKTGHDESPSMAPNGKMVVYATNSNDRGVLAEVSMDGRVKLLLPARDGEVQEPAWAPF